MWLINGEFYFKFLVLKNNIVEVEKYTVQLSSFTNIDEKGTILFSVFGATDQKLDLYLNLRCV